MSDDEPRPITMGNLGSDGGGVMDEMATTVTPAGDAVSPSRPRAVGGMDADMSDESSGANKAFRRGGPSQKGLPTKLGRYVLTERLGVGGMAEVFKATQDGVAGFQKTVVVKKILPHLAVDERFVEMFFREAKVAAQLAHPNIVQIHELGEDDETYFIVMEYLQGLSLFQLARRAWRAQRSLPMELAVYAIADAAHGLDYAYFLKTDDGQDLALIHRDISPDNLIMTEQAVTKVVDFGIAKASNTEDLTKTGEMKGKIPFMPRELLEPGGVLDHRSDLYALGITLYWLLTGQRPFRGETDLQVMQAIVAGDPIRPASLNAAIPPALEEITLSLLGRDQAQRPNSGREVASALLRLVSAERESVANFVIEMGKESALAPGARPHTTSGFLPAVPITGTLAAAQHTKPAPDTLGLDVDLGTIGTDLGTIGTGPRPAFASAPLTGSEEERKFQEKETQEKNAQENQDKALADLAAERGAEHHGTEDRGAGNRQGVDADRLLTADLVDEALGRGSRSPMLLALSAAAAVLVAGVVFSLGGGQQSDIPGSLAGTSAEEAAEPNAAPVAANKASDRTPPAAAQDPEPNAKATSTSTPTPGKGATNAQPLSSTSATKTKPGSSRVKTKVNKKVKVRAKKKVEVQAKAPRHIKWVDARGRPLGRGNATLALPSSTAKVFAFDTRRKVKSPATVTGGRVSYAEIKTGTLVLRVLPFADMVFLGNDKLGPAPMKPKEVKIGTYTLKVRREDQVTTKKVTIRAGRTEVVKIKL